MKLASVLLAVLLPFSAFCQGNANDNQIHWITSIDELQAKMQQSPKKVYIDMYTDWCGWCKKMDATTFQNPDLVKYMNNNFYAVRFNAETKDVIHFQGKDYKFDSAHRANMFAVEMMKGQLTYPTAIFLMENFQNPNPIPGYRSVSELEVMITYFGDNAFRHKSWDAYQKEYQPRWEHGTPAEVTAPPHVSPESPH